MNSVDAVIIKLSAKRVVERWIQKNANKKQS